MADAKPKAEEKNVESKDVAVGDMVLVLSDPRQNNGSEVAPAVVTRVWEGTPYVNLKVLLDEHEVHWLTSVTYCDSRPEQSEVKVLDSSGAETGETQLVDPVNVCWAK